MKKVAIGFFISFILLSVAFAPLTNAENYKTVRVENNDKYNLSNNDEKVKISVEFCNRYSFKEHEVFLNSDQINHLNFLIDDFNKELEEADTLDENIELYKDMIDSLDSLGLIPKNLGKEKAKKFVTKNNYYKAVLERTKKQPKFLDENENIFCLISGNSERGSRIEGPVSNFIKHLIDLLEKFGNNREIYLLALLWIALDIITLFPVVEFGHNIIPFRAYENIGFGGYYFEKDYSKIYFSSIAKVNTFGLNGKIQWDGELKGKLPVLPIYDIFNTYYTGVVGFSGIRITIDKDPGLDSFFLGTALWVKIDTVPPK
jgi:hypothetical protein